MPPHGRNPPYACRLAPSFQIGRIMSHLTPISFIFGLLFILGCEPPREALEAGRAKAKQPRFEPDDTATTLTGEVVFVPDGDSLTLSAGAARRRIRLHGIDCPERGQPFGGKAKRFTSAAALGKKVSVNVMDRDEYGRTVGIVTLPDGSILNHKLVGAGLAWRYVRHAPDDETLAALETEARRGKRGLWSHPSPMPPWQWRQRNR